MRAVSSFRSVRDRREKPAGLGNKEEGERVLAVRRKEIRFLVFAMRRHWSPPYPRSAPERTSIFRRRRRHNYYSRVFALFRTFLFVPRHFPPSLVKFDSNKRHTQKRVIVLSQGVVASRPRRRKLYRILLPPHYFAGQVESRRDKSPLIDCKLYVKAALHLYRALRPNSQAPYY